MGLEQNMHHHLILPRTMPLSYNRPTGQGTRADRISEHQLYLQHRYHHRPHFSATLRHKKLSITLQYHMRRMRQKVRYSSLHLPAFHDDCINFSSATEAYCR